MNVKVRDLANQNLQRDVPVAADASLQVVLMIGDLCTCREQNASRKVLLLVLPALAAQKVRHQSEDI